MKHRIYYFSGTGNSLNVAKLLKEKDPDIELCAMIDPTGPYRVDKTYDLVGFIYPIHINALPEVVAKFIKRLSIDGNPFIYAVATHGGKPGYAGANLAMHIKHLPWNLSAYYEHEMINNTPKGIAPKIMMTLDWENEITDEAINKMLLETNSFIDSLYATLLQSNSNINNLSPFKASGVGPSLMKVIWQLPTKAPTLKFQYDSSACEHCGTCHKVCTANRIEFDEKSPVWTSKKCNLCYACFNFCPKQAISVKHYNKKMGRYYYPDTTWQDIQLQRGYLSM